MERHTDSHGETGTFCKLYMVYTLLQYLWESLRTSLKRKKWTKCLRDRQVMYNNVPVLPLNRKEHVTITNLVMHLRVRCTEWLHQMDWRTGRFYIYSDPNVWIFSYQGTSCKKGYIKKLDVLWNIMPPVAKMLIESEVQMYKPECRVSSDSHTVHPLHCCSVLPTRIEFWTSLAAQWRNRHRPAVGFCNALPCLHPALWMIKKVAFKMVQ